MADTHELLSKREFVDRLEPLGYARLPLSKLFMTLARASLNSFDPRSSTDIGYQEVDRAGEEEVVISIPNLAVRLDDLQSIPEIGVGFAAICARLIEISTPDHSPDTEAPS